MLAAMKDIVRQAGFSIATIFPLQARDYRAAEILFKMIRSDRLLSKPIVFPAEFVVQQPPPSCRQEE
jgi:DNA-binding LacI/PurR family transcriptional regulator